MAALVVASEAAGSVVEAEVLVASAVEAAAVVAPGEAGRAPLMGKEM